MKRILVITVVFCLIGVLTGTAQEVRNDPPEFEKSSTPNDKMQRSWLWSEGTKFTGTTLVFTSDKKIQIGPAKEKLHIYCKKYESSWTNYNAYIRTEKGHSAFLLETMALGSDVSTVDFKFENLKVVGSEMTGTCTFSISYGFKGDKELKELKGDKVPVKFISSGLITITSNQPNPNNAGQLGDPKIPKSPLTESEKFDQDVLKEIQNLIKDNPGKTDLQLQKAAQGIRKKEGNSPKWVAVEHYFFALHYTSFLGFDQAIGNTGIIPNIGNGMGLGLVWEAWQLTGGNLAGAAAEYIMGNPSLWPGPRGDFRTNILQWGRLGTMGWRP
jgi:hypothetical protein